MNETYIKNVVEAALLAAGRPLQLAELAQLFDESARPESAVLRAALEGLEADYSGRGIEVKETATGFRIQVRRDLANEVSRLWPERPPRYSRALLETLALIAYRQPITRAEIEAVRGVAVNPNIIKTILERNWVRVVGTRDVPGRPELLGTTKEFLDYFGLRSLEELPPLAELRAMGEINLQLDLAKPGDGSDTEGGGSGSSGSGSDGTNGAGGANGAEGGAQGSGDAVAAVAAAAAAVAVVAEVAEVPEVAEAANDTGEPEQVAAELEPIAPTVASAPVDETEAPVAAVAEVETSEGAGAPEEAIELAHEPAAAPVVHADIEADSGDVTVEVETLGLVEARIEASIEADEAAPAVDSSIETGEFEMAELGMTPPASLIEAEFEAEDLDNAVSDEEAADDEEELSAGPHGSSELVAAPRDRDD
jgi:segregation and condensation protein B